MKMKESELTNDWIQSSEKTVEHEGDNDTNCG